MSYPNIEIVVVADTAMPDDVAAEVADLCGDRLRMVWYDLPFSYSHKVNRGVVCARGEYILLLNDDIEVITTDWIENMLGLAQEADVGMVGAELYFEDGTIQHAGHLYRDRHGIGHIGYGIDGGTEGPGFTFMVQRECSGVTAACAMLRRRDYLDVGGLSRELPINFNDVDLSLKIRASGKRIVWTPFAKLYHFESKTRDVFVASTEIDRIQRRWGHQFDLGDPYWRHLELTQARPPVELVESY